MSTPQNVARLNKAIEDRARELGKTFNQVARDAGITTETLSALRGKGKKRGPDSRPYEKTARGVDRALKWSEGTTMAIWDGRELTVDDDSDPTVTEIENSSLTREQKDVLISVYRAQRTAQRQATLQQMREMEDRQRRGA